MLQLISVVFLIYSYFLIQSSIPALPRLIPTHFNAAGVADGWGSPETLWILLGAQALTTTVFLLVPYLGLRRPSMVHFGTRRLSDFSPAQQARIIPMLKDMSGLLSIVANLFFVYILRQIIRAAAQPIPHLPVYGPLVLLVAGTAGISLIYLRMFYRIAQDGFRNDVTS